MKIIFLYVLFCCVVVHSQIIYGPYSNYDLTTSMFPPKAGCPVLPTPVDSILNPVPASIKLAFEQAEVAMNDLRGALGTVGVSVAVVYNQTLMWSKGFGFADANKQTPVTLDTIFRVGSVSKVFTALEMMIQRDRGVIHLDDDLKKFFPDLYLTDYWAGQTTKGMTYRQLATHLAGLPREDPCEWTSHESANGHQRKGKKKAQYRGKGRNCNVTNAEMFKRLHKLHTISPPDYLPVYSNLGFSLLGNLLAARANMTFSNMIKNDILYPLNLKNTGDMIAEANPSLLATPYLQSGAECSPDDCLSDYGWGNPAGSFYSTARDLSALMSLFFRDDVKLNVNDGQILDGASIRDMFRPQWINTDMQSGFCMPFEIVKFHDYFLKTKRGDVNGYATEILMIPEYKLGMLVLTNIVEHAPYYTKPLAKIVIPAFQSAFEFLKQKPPLPPNPSIFTGRYSEANDRTNITVTLQNGYLRIYSGELSLDNTLTWKYDTVFDLSPPFGDMSVCWDVQSGGYYQNAFFDAAGTTLRFDMGYGLLWKKHELGEW